MEANIIIIGDEVLIGDTVDTNSSWIAAELDKIGIRTSRITTVGDDAEVITQALDEAMQVSELILITGGLGPTHDDITKQTLARYFNDELVESEEVLDDIRELMKKFGRDIGKLNTTQAQVPGKCEVIRNRRGTAPGMIFNENGHMVVSMPGVPNEMRGMMKHTVLPKLSARPNRNKRLHRYLKTFGIAEASLAEKLSPMMKDMPGYIKMAYLPSPGHVRIRLSASSDAADDVEKQLDDWIEKYRIETGSFVYGSEDDTLEKVVGKLLTEKGSTVSTAESCTGGNLAGKITSVPGSSNYFKGSVIAYANEVKVNQLKVSKSDLEQRGAVSEEVVKAMADGVRDLMDTDYGLATSGIAGPDGGTPEKPVGTIWIAIAGPDEVKAKKLQLGFDRSVNIRLTVDHVLDMLRRELQ